MNSFFSLEHLGLAARDPAALKDWYVKMLEAEVVFAMRQEPPAFLINLGGMLVEIYPAESVNSETGNNRLAGWRHIALKVGSIEDARARLESRGISFSESIKAAGGGGRVLFFKDPEGNLLHFAERLPEGFR